jgi:hypothetical protein
MPLHHSGPFVSPFLSHGKMQGEFSIDHPICPFIFLSPFTWLKISTFFTSNRNSLDSYQGTAVLFFRACALCTSETPRKE